jgi:hypothetical protein
LAEHGFDRFVEVLCLPFVIQRDSAGKASRRAFTSACSLSATARLSIPSEASPGERTSPSRSGPMDQRGRTSRQFKTGWPSLHSR